MTTWILEERQCECGCPMRFRCLPTSPQRFACRECEARVTKGGMIALFRRDAATISRQTRRRNREIKKLTEENQEEVEEPIFDEEDLPG